VIETGDAPHFSCLEYSHAFVDIFHLLGRVGYASGTFSTPYAQEEDDPGCERRELRKNQERVRRDLKYYVNKMYAYLEVRRRVLWGSPSLKIYYMRA
jgi:hypothetical protein